MKQLKSNFSVYQIIIVLYLLMYLLNIVLYLIYNILSIEYLYMLSTGESKYANLFSEFSLPDNFFMNSPTSLVPGGSSNSNQIGQVIQSNNQGLLDSDTTSDIAPWTPLTPSPFGTPGEYVINIRDISIKFVRKFNLNENFIDLNHYIETIVRSDRCLIEDLLNSPCFMTNDTIINLIDLKYYPAHLCPEDKLSPYLIYEIWEKADPSFSDDFLHVKNYIDSQAQSEPLFAKYLELRGYKVESP